MWVLACFFFILYTILLNFYTDLQYSRTFATRNGFGPVPIPPLLSKNENKNVTMYRESYHLLSTFTGAEEAAIHQNSQLISIVRFPHGSLGSKGNTTCVWQQSKLNLILPNLPEECKFVIIRHKQKKKDGKSQLKSTKFERRKIQRALVLLSHTVDGV